MYENSFELSQGRSIVYSTIMANQDEVLYYESVASCPIAKFARGSNRLLYGVESAPTPKPQLNCVKWRGLILGVM